MIYLSKMLLINWHNINQELIDFGPINFLTGPTGSGKSTAIDALQILLLGKADGSFFNKAAATTVKKQEKRSLKGYLYNSIGVGSNDEKSDEESENKEEGNLYRRQGSFTSYLIAEFTEIIPGIEKSQFCYGIVFDCAFPSDPEKYFFWFKSGIPDDKFVKNQIPTPGYNLGAELKERFGKKHSEIFSVDRLYQEHLRAALGNFGTRFHELFRRAVPFDPSIDLAQFLSDFACDVDTKIDVSGMQDSIAHYSKLLAESNEVKKQISVLTEISKNYKDFVNYDTKAILYQFVVDKGTEDHARIQLDSKIKHLKNNIDESEKLKNTMDFLKREELRLKIEHKKAQESYYAESSRLKYHVKTLEFEIVRIEQDIKRIDDEVKKVEAILREYYQHWTRVASKITRLKDKDNSIFAVITSSDRQIVSDIHQCINKMVSYKNDIAGWIEILSWPISSTKLDLYFHNQDEWDLLAGNLKAFIEVSTSANGHIREVIRRLKLRLSELASEINTLNNGFKPINKTLEAFLADLRTGMGSEGEHAQIRLLCDCIEINDCEWQNAIEGYLGRRRFHILVEPRAHKLAVATYKRLRKEKAYHSIGIVDGGRLLVELAKINDGSLAEEIKTDDQVARAYINYVLGRVMKADSVEMMNKFRTAMTKDCWRYQGYVCEPLDPEFYRYLYIGKKSIQLRLAQAIAEKEYITNSLELISSQIYKVELCAQPEVPTVIELERIRLAITEIKKLQALYDSKSLLVMEKMNVDKNNLNQLLIEAQDAHDRWIEAQNKKIESEKRIEFLNSESIFLEGQIPNLEFQYSEAKSKIAQYDFDWVDFAGEPFYSKCLTKVNDPQAVVRNYASQVSQFRRLREESLSTVKSLRIKYATDFPPAIGALDLESTLNDDWDKEYNKLVNSALPEYDEQIAKSKQRSYEQFQTDFISRLYQNISSARQQIEDLSSALEDVVFGNGVRFKLKVEINNRYRRFYNMIMDESLSQGQNIFATAFQEKYADTFKEFFDKFIPPESEMISDQYLRNLNNDAKILTDYRTYLNFEMKEIQPTGETISLTRSMNVRSGGESQTVFYVSVLASFMKLYRTKEKPESHTFRLVVFDEAFSKMDPTRVKNSLQWLRETGLQVILAAPPEKAAYIVPYIDKTLVTVKSNEGTIILPLEYKETENDELGTIFH